MKNDCQPKLEISKIIPMRFIPNVKNNYTICKKSGIPKGQKMAVLKANGEFLLASGIYPYFEEKVIFQ